MKKYSDEQLDYVKHNFTAMRAAKKLGIKVEKNSILCPFHNDRKYNSCNYDRHKGKFFCFVCHKYISGIDLVMHELGYSFTEAVEYAAADLGYTLLKLDHEKEKKRLRAPMLSTEDAAFLEFPEDARQPDYRSERVRIPINLTYDKEEAKAAEDYSPEYYIPEGGTIEDEEVRYIINKTVPNPWPTYHLDNPIGYAVMITKRCDFKMQEMRLEWQLAMKEGNLSIADLAKQLYKRAYDLRRKFFLQHPQDILRVESDCCQITLMILHFYFHHFLVPPKRSFRTFWISFSVWMSYSLQILIIIRLSLVICTSY